MENLSLEDSNTLQAISILADVLDKVSGPTILDTVLVSKALRQVLATKSQPAFDFASRAFMTLDPELRVKIAEDAEEAVQETMKLRGRVSGLLNDMKARPPGSIPGPAPRSQPSQPTSFLAALNSRAFGRRPAEGRDDE
ncbi:MAG TPA: hypothetical protein VEB64_16670 [Azospirillaceae bacterium]|nr:hypothetical protein [Azospirillaceae bacterium]